MYSTSKAWDAFRLVSTNHKELIEDMLSLYHNVSLKIHMLHSHLHFFPDNCGMVRDEHGDFIRKLQRWRNDIKEKLSTSMLADYCWTLARNAPE